MGDPNMGDARILVYGSYGYTGDLIVRNAIERGIPLTLAGRNEAKLKAQAEQSGYTYHVFDLSERDKTLAALEQVDMVIHCAGPFLDTFQPMVDACLETNTHYTDITGEARVYESLSELDLQAKAAGIMLLPGIGFDVVPSDCLAAHLKSRCPNAVELELAWRQGGPPSQGTAITVAENTPLGGLARINGKLEKVPTAWKLRDIDFGDGRAANCMSIPWGDVVTAWHSTGIPNIMVYMDFPKPASLFLKVVRPFLGLTGSKFVQGLIRNKIKAGAAGPSDTERESSANELWGEVRDANGNAYVSRMHMPAGYTFTALMALTVAEKVNAGEFKAGFQTPSLVYGKELVFEVSDVRRWDENEH